MEIKRIKDLEDAPMNLLLLADPSLKIVEDYLARGECYVAFEGEAIVGVYVLLPRGLRFIELVNIAVKENMQGKGIGRKMVLHAIENSKQKGYDVIQIGTGNSSIGQLALYQKCGFRIIGVRKDYFTDHYEEEIVENGIRCRDMLRLEKNLQKEG
ncbi:GNAT family N-acetyltransferase [Virgibacillus halodenitrificans]|jgi:ribosomal protein S18 acetylase RimI-like enzyme|uniref:GNAT family N-acetyltransferase n=1 Tax=Virgibacillus halodenitrificans TaxID=1482 RepID=A0AAC9IXZ4_VIRHA|nr:GNAT family N-acetyltransferase [Virgibacillus halodenitrificans]APC47298.1 GNAT family N-acetyltransferase [Virgibacillus halodenitrificans]MCG1029651.1 GNAT family N-acetyltransferase [Virgibacillus halodenitrificans]MCJ0932422.1 GNAT family N-acetyltransferase [Virgibacillus halodenitrificans]